jgi:hypothetical protein
MTATRRILIASVAVLCTAACGTSTPTAPSGLASGAPRTLAVTESSARSADVAAVSCTVDVGATTHPLPAFHVYVNWLNASTAASDLQCGQVNSLDQKMELLAEALDADPPAFEKACGVSTAAAREINALTKTGQLPVLTFPAPVPGGPTTLEQIAGFLSETWCAAARGEITGPRS